MLFKMIKPVKYVTIWSSIFIDKQLLGKSGFSIKNLDDIVTYSHDICKPYVVKFVECRPLGL